MYTCTKMRNEDGFAAIRGRVLHHYIGKRLINAHSPEPVELSVQTLVAKVKSRKNVAVKNRERLPTLPRKTRFARSPNITVRSEDERIRGRHPDWGIALFQPQHRVSPSSPFWACIPLPHFLSRHAQKPQRSSTLSNSSHPLSLSLSSNSTRLSIIDKQRLII